MPVQWLCISNVDTSIILCLHVCQLKSDCTLEKQFYGHMWAQQFLFDIFELPTFLPNKIEMLTCFVLLICYILYVCWCTNCCNSSDLWYQVSWEERGLIKLISLPPAVSLKWMELLLVWAFFWAQENNE